MYVSVPTDKLDCTDFGPVAAVESLLNVMRNDHQDIPSSSLN